jgi:hypothetical protein
MNINRHNYEEYFILYADNELSSDDRRMVEEFISLNPDLKDELDVFLGTVLSPDISFKFDNKEELHHYDESLISYIDNELSYKEELELEKLINGSPKLQQELELYRKTKLQPATDIIFENKYVLYRSTERRRVVPMTIIRWSVAAAVLLAIAITAVNILNNKSDAPPIVNQPSKDTQKIPEQNIASTPTEQPKDTASLKNDDIQADIVKNDEQKKPENKKKVNIPVVPIEEKQKENIAANISQPPSNNLPTEYGAIESSGRDYTAPVTDGQKNVKDAQTPVTNLKADRIIYAGGPTTITDGPNEEGGNKKSRGFFRKLTRVLEKNTGIKATDDDEKLHIAAFTVKLK